MYESRLSLMTVASPYHASSPQQRGKTPVVITYTKQRESLIGVNYAQRRRQSDWQFVYKAFLFGVFLVASGLYIAAETNYTSPTTLTAKNVGDFLRRRRHHLSQKNNKSKILRHYRRPRKNYERTFWTMSEFTVNGVNLASYGFETTENPSQLLNEHFLLYDDFDISHDLSEHTIAELEGTLVTPCATDLLLYRRHLEHPSLAFYMDKVALKRYYNATGIPSPTPFVVKYQDQWTNDNRQLNDGQAISTFLPDKTDYVVKASHRAGETKSTRLVSYDEQSTIYVMGSHSDNIREDYDADGVAQHLALAMRNNKNIQFTDPWALLHVNPGIVVEDRITCFDSPHQPALSLQVYVIWGKVWMVSWPRAEGLSHPAMIHRNGSAVMDDHAMVKVPEWLQWETIVTLAEDLGAHKDLYQVNILVGAPAETAKLLQHSSRKEQLAAIQVIVADTKLNPSISFHEKELLDEMGRLWLAGYQIGIYKSVPNMEVPSDYVQQQQHLTEEDAQKQPFLARWAMVGVDWKTQSTVKED